MTLHEQFDIGQYHESVVDEASLLASVLCNATIADQTQQAIANVIFDNLSNQKTRKLKEILLNPSAENKSYLKAMISSRMEQGRGETLFVLGIEEDGSSMNLSEDDLKQCLDTISEISSELNADFANIDELNGLHSNSTCKTTTTKTEKGLLAHLMIRKRPQSVEEMTEIRIAVVGNVDAGKSTMLGVLARGVLDDGRGKARANLFRHKHEVESGRTSSIGSEMIGFDSKSNLTLIGNNKKVGNNDGVIEKAAKLLSFVDLAGHGKYLKTTVFGMTGCAPEFAMLMVGANAGMIGMSREHLGLALSLGIPVFIVITKIDRCPSNILEETTKELVSILKSKSCRKMPLFVKNNQDVITTAQNFVGERLCPIFHVSNVTGEGLDLVRNFLNVMPSSAEYDPNKPFHFEISEIYSVPYVGTVVSGVVRNGIVCTGDKVLLGPDFHGHFLTTTIKGIHRKRVPVSVARAGQSVTFALKNVRRNAIRKGQVLLPYDKDMPDNIPRTSKRFEAEIRILYHSTTIKSKYQAVVHCGAVRQTARIITTEKTVLRTGDHAKVEFEFLKHPEYLTVGSRLIFREGRTKGVGTITQLLADDTTRSSH